MPVPKRNYGHEKRQRETARKARQQKKLERRQTRPPTEEPEDQAATARDPEGEAAP